MNNWFWDKTDDGRQFKFDLTLVYDVDHLYNATVVTIIINININNTISIATFVPVESATHASAAARERGAAERGAAQSERDRGATGAHWRRRFGETGPCRDK
jgi:hypothetical protein